MMMTGDDLEDLRAFDDPPSPPRWKMWGRLLQLWGRLLLRSRVLPKLAAHLFCFEHTAQISHLLPSLASHSSPHPFLQSVVVFLPCLHSLLWKSCSIGCLLILRVLLKVLQVLCLPLPSVFSSFQWEKPALFLATICQPHFPSFSNFHLIPSSENF